MNAPAPAAQVIGLLASLALAFVAAALGALATTNSTAFYGQLDRPAWAPPASVFGSVWSVLYLLMAIAAWLVWRARGLANARHALGLYALQLVFNALWTWLFFAWHLGPAALADAVLLALLVAWTTVMFWRARRLAGVLMLPYLAWVSFAAALTYAIWRRNPALL